MAQDKVLLFQQHFQKNYTGFYLLKTLHIFLHISLILYFVYI